MWDPPEQWLHRNRVAGRPRLGIGLCSLPMRKYLLCESCLCGMPHIRLNLAIKGLARTVLRSILCRIVRHHLQPNGPRPICSKCHRSTNAHHRFQNNDNSCLKKLICTFAISKWKRTNPHSCEMPTHCSPILGTTRNALTISKSRPIIAQGCQIDKNLSVTTQNSFTKRRENSKNKFLTAWRTEPQDRRCLLVCNLSTILLVTFTRGPNSWLILALLWTLRISCGGVSGP